MNFTIFLVSAMRLCFQVYLGGLGDLPLNPVYSDIIYSSHDRQHRNLKIEKKSSNWAPIQCGKEILLFCSTAPENVKVYFSFSDTGMYDFFLEMLLFHNMKTYLH